MQFPRWLTPRIRHFWLCVHFWTSGYIISHEEFCYKPGYKKRAERGSRMQIPHALPKVIEGVFYRFRYLGKDHPYACRNVMRSPRPANKLVGHYFCIGLMCGTWLPGPTANPQWLLWIVVDLWSYKFSRKNLCSRTDVAENSAEVRFKECWVL